MTLDRVIEILEASDVVEDYDVQDDGVRFWVFTGSYVDSRQRVLDEIEDIDDVTLIDEGVRNDWYWYFVTRTD